MKIVKIIGGLGNQMFQYAFFLSLKNKKNNVKIDISAFSNYNLHQGFELKAIFDIEPNDNLDIEVELKALKDNRNFLKWRKILGKLFFFDPNKFLKHTHFIQPNYSKFYSNIFLTENIYLDGYWQSEKYFEEIKEEIIEQFKWKNISFKNLELSKKMELENSIAIHIRRSDKLKNFKQLSYYLQLHLVWRVASKKYYMDSITYISKKVNSPKYYIFTDDLTWVRKNLPINSEYKIIDWNRDKDSHWDMYLMSKCKHNIIAMSSFSWWGAWLNRNPNKIIIAPKRWALRFVKDIDLIPKSWVRI